ncbi:MAG TPA: tetratricopeptide repeat protein [Vicinamibacteria bacterium]|nr:tetratricopeptide repeat protein [Vicinamibacteria bacterium]
MVSLPGLGDDAEPLAELEGTGGGGGVVVLGFLALAAVSGAACWYVREGPAPKQPSPDIFTLATLPASPAPLATPAPEKPGAKDFEEGRRLLAGGDAAKAIPFLSRAVGVAPGNALFHDVLGQALAATGAQDQAFAQFGEAARVDRARFGRSLAERLADAGRDTEAARAYEQVLAGTPDDPFAQEGLGRMQYRLGNYTQAVPLLQQAVKTRSDDPVLQQELGYALQSTGDIKGAIDVYRSVLALAPGAEIARGLLADLVYEEGKPDDAIALVQEGLQRDPKSALLRTRLGSLLEQSGRPREAAEQYREYAHLAPNAPDAKELADRAERLEASSGGS